MTIEVSKSTQRNILSIEDPDTQTYSSRFNQSFDNIIATIEHLDTYIINRRVTDPKAFSIQSLSEEQITKQFEAEFNLSSNQPTNTDELKRRLMTSINVTYNDHLKKYHNLLNQLKEKDIKITSPKTTTASRTIQPYNLNNNTINYNSYHIPGSSITYSNNTFNPSTNTNTRSDLLYNVTSNRPIKKQKEFLAKSVNKTNCNTAKGTTTAGKSNKIASSKVTKRNKVRMALTKQIENDILEDERLPTREFYKTETNNVIRSERYNLKYPANNDVIKVKSSNGKQQKVNMVKTPKVAINISAFGSPSVSINGVSNKNSLMGQSNDSNIEFHNKFNSSKSRPYSKGNDNRKIVKIKIGDTYDSNRYATINTNPTTTTNHSKNNNFTWNKKAKAMLLDPSPRISISGYCCKS